MLIGMRPIEIFEFGSILQNLLLLLSRHIVFQEISHTLFNLVTNFTQNESVLDIPSLA